MQERYDRVPELRLQTIEPSPELPKLPPLTDLATRLTTMLCDDPTDPDMVGLESYLYSISKRAS